MDSLKNEVQRLISSNKIQCLFQKAFVRNAYRPPNGPICTWNDPAMPPNSSRHDQNQNYREMGSKEAGNGIDSFSTNFNSQLISSLYQNSEKSISENKLKPKKSEMGREEGQTKAPCQDKNYFTSQRKETCASQNLEIVHNYVNCRESLKNKRSSDCDEYDKTISGHVRYSRKRASKRSSSNTQANSQNETHTSERTPSVVDVLKGISAV